MYHWQTVSINIIGSALLSSALDRSRHVLFLQPKFSTRERSLNGWCREGYAAASTQLTFRHCRQYWQFLAGARLRRTTREALERGIIHSATTLLPPNARQYLELSEFNGSTESGQTTGQSTEQSTGQSTGQSTPSVSDQRHTLRATTFTTG